MISSVLFGSHRTSILHRDFPFNCILYTDIQSLLSLLDIKMPLSYRMWQKKESKLELAASMVRQVMPELAEKKNVILLCDNWYTKGDLVSVVDEYQNLGLIGNARYDSVLYDPAPQPTGKRGRPAKHGRRLFFSTVFPAQLQIFCAWQEKTPLNQMGSAWMDDIPLFLYPFRWNIEVGYYEQKTFWSLCSYMVRSRKGIEMLVNLINIAYCAMKLLPYQDEAFSKYRRESVQDFRFALSERIRQEVFLPLS